MSPLHLSIGESATVTAINTQEELRSRLNSLGLNRGSELTIESTSLFKGTYCIRLNNSNVLAIRRDELAMIEVAI
ncbi:MAG TPA: ferrous iron transport protein A [Nitratifractor sp.]|jgi:Fe2+ transport system protein FeoA|nr:ferrous iron transport protein A [Nitratifractor sp.]HHD74367.1 ferrous iron transport protein A [Nitratifractor sp.]